MTSDNSQTEPFVRMRLPNILSISIIVLLAVNYFGPFADLDFAWQIKTGQEIVETGKLRTPDTFTYTITGQLVPDFEWLYEVILWAVWSGFGFGGLKFLKTILVAGPLVLLALRLRREGVKGHGVALALFTAVAVLAPAWNLRPMSCTTIGLLLVSGWLHDHCSGRRPLSWWLPVVMLLWSNLHPGVIVGQGLLAGAIAWEWLNRWVRLNTPLDRHACRRLTLIGGAGLAVTFLSPDPLERVLYPFRPEIAHPIMRIFAEMQPTYRFILTPPFATNLAYLVAGLVALTVVLRFRRYRLWEIGLLVGLGGLANMAFRSLADWLLVMLALGVPHLAVLLRDVAKANRRRPWVSGLLRLDRSCKRTLLGQWFRFQPFWPTLAFSLLALISVIVPLAKRMPIQDAADCPIAAVTRIEELQLRGRFFAPPDYGSYLIWRMGNRAQSYVDTRGFFFPPTLLEDSVFLPAFDADWPERLERVLVYGTDYFLLETTGPRGKLWQALQPHVAAPLYLDDRTVVLSSDQVRDGLRAWSRANGDQMQVTRAAKQP